MDRLVSVNITTYNREKLLPRCLDSVLNQSFENIEVIIVDDCSNDATESAIKRYIAADGRIKYIRHLENKGNAHARNTALAHCTGYYVAFMDDDDEWIDRDKLRKQVDFFEKSDNEKLGIICTSVRLFSDASSYVDKVVGRPENLKARILSGNGIIYSPTVMTRRDLMIKAGGFDTELPRGVDSDFYRNCIIKLDYDVHFMHEVTTGVHEYGANRMTPQQSLDSISKSIKTHTYTLIKYFRFYLMQPKGFYNRAKSLMFVLLKYLKIRATRCL